MVATGGVLLHKTRMVLVFKAVIECQTANKIGLVLSAPLDRARQWHMNKSLRGHHVPAVAKERWSARSPCLCRGILASARLRTAVANAAR